MVEGCVGGTGASYFFEGGGGFGGVEKSERFVTVGSDFMMNICVRCSSPQLSKTTMCKRGTLATPRMESGSWLVFLFVDELVSSFRALISDITAKSTAKLYIVGSCAWLGRP